jgi:hypothetical protein
MHDIGAIDIEVRGYFPCRGQPRELASSPTAESANSDAPLKGWFGDQARFQLLVWRENRVSPDPCLPPCFTAPDIRRVFL